MSLPKRPSRWLLTVIVVACSILPTSYAGEGFSQTPTEETPATENTPTVDQTLPPVSLEPAFPNLNFARPVDLAAPPDGSNRLVVVEQPGRILIFPNTQEAAAEVFLDIGNRINSGGEEGLLGIAFHPEYAENGFFFVRYTAIDSNGRRRRIVISRFQVSPTNPDQADPNSELVILEIEKSVNDANTGEFSNHNAGRLAFGPDGYLYIPTGDGGGAGDRDGNGQNRGTLLGKVLRIDVNASTNQSPYAIPADNPYINNTQGFRAEIFAYGLRNPYTFSFDPEANQIWLADVGQDRFEEINLIGPGQNYGWNITEGNACFRPATNCDTAGLTPPVFTYGRDQGQSITGGYVYRGTSRPDLIEAYIYADFVSGRVWALRYDGEQVTENEQLLQTELNISGFGVDENQELYLLAFDGRIYRFR